jgi:hypothetical protein
MKKAKPAEALLQGRVAEIISLFKEIVLRLPSSRNPNPALF